MLLSTRLLFPVTCFSLVMTMARPLSLEVLVLVLLLLHQP